MKEALVKGHQCRGLMDKLARKARGTKKGEFMPVSIVEAYKGEKGVVMIMTGFSW